MSQDTVEARIAYVRAFNRFFTRQIGVLREGLLHSPYSITEVRILYELANYGDQLVSALGRGLGLDQGYISRILAKFEQEGLVVKVRSDTDGRARPLRLTEAGRAAFAPLDRRSHDEVGEMLATLSEPEQQSLVGAMQTIETLLATPPGLKYAQPFFLRAHQDSDLAWIAHRHGIVYGREYGWDFRFEAMVAQVCADLMRQCDPQREHCWIAEIQGERVGSVALTRGPEVGVAKLRLLLVEPQARGYGLGTRLVEECIAFARRTGYRKVELWTNSLLSEARDIYQKCGFVLVSSEPHDKFGEGLIAETWALTL